MVARRAGETPGATRRHEVGARRADDVRGGRRGGKSPARVGGRVLPGTGPLPRRVLGPGGNGHLGQSTGRRPRSPVEGRQFGSGPGRSRPGEIPPGTQKSWRRPIFPKGCPLSIFGAGELDFRVRDGNGYGLSASVTRIRCVWMLFGCDHRGPEGRRGRRFCNRSSKSVVKTWNDPRL